MSRLSNITSVNARQFESLNLKVFGVRYHAGRLPGEVSNRVPRKYFAKSGTNYANSGPAS